MDYLKVYKKLIEKSKNRILPDETHLEEHHIFPKFLGGSDNEDNLVKLTTKEHFMAHKLLYKMHFA